jgi:hypothetical protein
MKHLRKVLISAFVVYAVLTPSCPALRAQSYDTNSLWLELAMTNSVGCFTIHPPATNAEGIYDLYLNTNLLVDQNWTWLIRNGPGQTNLTVTNLPPGLSFFRLGVTNAIRPGFDQQVLYRNDDDSTGRVGIGFYINFYGSSNTTLYVNNNGDVTFDYPQSEYTPKNLTNLGVKVIAPYWADVDTRNELADEVKYGTNTVDGCAAFGVDWVNVGYFSWHADRLLSCQLVIIDRSDINPGDFDMEFNYDKVQWEWGDASLNNPPHAGFSSMTAGYELPGSGVAGAFLDSTPATGLIYHNLNSSVPGRYIFRFRDGLPLP